MIKIITKIYEKDDIRIYYCSGYATMVTFKGQDIVGWLLNG